MVLTTRRGPTQLVELYLKYKELHKEDFIGYLKWLDQLDDKQILELELKLVKK